jgi:tRNA-specific 2-thiouridylase
MLEKLEETMDFDLFATGHYAQCSRDFHDVYSANLMLESVDQMKDQTFYLSGLNEAQINKSCFPIGGLNKNIVKSIAHKNGLSYIASKKESQEIGCSIRLVKYSAFNGQSSKTGFGQKVQLACI